MMHHPIQWFVLLSLQFVPWIPLQAQLVYSQNFDAAIPPDRLEGWIKYDEPLAEGRPSLWVTKEYLGRVAIAQISNIYAPGPHHRGSWITREDGQLKDGSVEVLMTCTDDDVVGILFRYQDPENFYVFDMTEQKRRPWEGRGDSRWARLQKCRHGQYTLLDWVETPTYHNNDGVWHAIRVVAQGEHFEAFFDGNRLLEASDPSDPIEQGTVGLAAWAQSSVLFDDLRVNGQLIDDFDRDVRQTTPQGWRAFEEPGLRGGPAHWQVGKIGDETALIQYSNAYKPNDDRRGTWIVLENHTWERMVFDWDMLNTDDDVVGALFRYQDPQNCYILEMSLQPRAPERGLEPTSWVRLRKRVAGEYTLLGWTDKTPYDLNVWHHVRISADGPHFQVWIDEVLYLDVVDDLAGPSRGTIGFSCYAQQIAAFDNVRVIGPLDVGSLSRRKTLWGAVKSVIPPSKPGQWGDVPEDRSPHARRRDAGRSQRRVDLCAAE